MKTTLTQNEIGHLIHGPVGELEVVVAMPEVSPRSAWGIVCHPHPLHGGTMHNKVVTTLSKTFQGLGIPTVRFNFRGVGKSAGEFNQGEGELDDLLAVMDWVQQQEIKNEIWLAGFSFGAYVAAKAASHLPIHRLVLVAPPVENFPMQNLKPITCPWIVVQGGEDDVVAAEKVLAWAESRESKPTIIELPQAGHFFHGQLGELRAKLTEKLLHL